MKGNELAVGILLLVILVAITIKPLTSKLKVFKRLSIHTITGLVLLLILNIFGTYINIYLPINFATIMISITMGLPGVTMLITLKILLIR